jgi:hypothetical protein
MTRLYAIPDIHGRKDLLDKLLEKLYTEEKLDLTQDKLIFLGDMIDRGADSKGVMDTIRDLLEKHPTNVVALAGNHEWLAIGASINPSNYDKVALWEMNGGDSTRKSFSPHTNIPDDYIRWMALLPLSHEEPGFFFSHAPVPREDRRLLINKGQPFTNEELTWTYSIDELGIARDHGYGIVGVCGHIHALRKGIFEPRFYDHYIFADAGCGCHPRAPLVAIEVRTRKVITVLSII